MKKIILTILSVGLFTSCASITEYVQIVDIQSKSVPLKGGNFVFEDENCSISYDFWSSHGNPGFVIENLTNEMLYVNLENTFFIRNGMAHDYFLKRSHGMGKSSVSTAGHSASASAFGVWPVYNLPGSKSLSLSGASSVGSTSTINYEEKEFAIVPPHAKKYFSEYPILGDVIQDCSVRLFPKRNKNDSKTFQEEQTPATFGNYITYKVGANGNDCHVTNDFYIAGFANYRLADVKERIKVGCHEQVNIETNKYQRPTRYFFYYNENHNNDNSADAKDFNPYVKFYEALY